MKRWIIFILAIATVVIATEYVYVVVPKGTDPNDLFSSKFDADNTWTGSNSFDDVTISGNFVNTNNDMSVSYMGYPVVTLTTNMFTIYKDSSATAITFANIEGSVLDGDMSTYSTGTNGSSRSVTYNIDLGVDYEGFMVVKDRLNVGSGESMRSWKMSTHELAEHDFDIGEPDLTTDTAYTIVQDAGGSTIQTQVLPVCGRYLDLTYQQGGAGGSQTHDIFEITVYANTNGFRNMGGF